MQAQVLVPTKEMDRQTWLEWRRRGIGGSDAAAIAGLSRWKSPVAVWLEKTGQIVEEEDNEKMYWGRVLEDIVAQEFSRRTGLKVRRCNAILQHPDYPFMIANVDRLVVGQKAGLECKTAGEYSRDEWEGDNIPDEYILQCHHYMAVTGFHRWFIAVLVGGNRFQHTVVERDQEIIDYLIKIESDFWQLVETNTPPPLDGSPSSSEVLRLLYPASKTIPEEIELPEDALDLIFEREEILRQINELEERQASIENQIKAMLGENESGRIGSYLVSWQTVRSTRLDTTKVKSLYPEVYANCSKESTYRRFNVKKLRRV